MRIKLNLKNNFKLVEEGERVLTITKAEAKPSGKPTSLVVSFQDTDGGYITSRYDFTNDKSLFAMGKLLETALGFEDGDEFDTKTDPERLVGLTLLCEVVHTQGTKPNENGELPTFANLKRTISLMTTADGEVSSNVSPRSAIAIDDEEDLD